MAFFTLIPVLYLLVVIGLIYFFFRIFIGILKANEERNDILRDIYEQLKRQNERKNSIDS